MPTFEFTSPEGKSYEIEGPEGATREQAFGILQQQLASGSPPATKEPSATVSAGRTINDIPRQLGLTGRYAAEGLANTAQIVTEPIRQALIGLGNASRNAQKESGGMFAPNGNTLSNLVAPPQTPNPMPKPLGQAVSDLATQAGLPTPQTPLERTVGEGAKLGFGAMGMGGAAGKAADIIGDAAPAATNLLRGLAANPTSQVTSAVGAGTAGQASKEAGGGPMQQFGASLLGGLTGGAAPDLVKRGADAVRGAVAPLLSRMTPEQMDVQIERLVTAGGQDYSLLSDATRRGLRAELASALQAGKQLDPQAVSRLAAFRDAGVTPTRGMISQDPVQITREQNLAKMAANSGADELHGLPRLQNQNNTALIGRLNDLGAGRGDSFAAGQQAIGSIAARDAAEQARVGGMYTAARALPGGETPLDRTAVVNGIYDALGRENKLAFLPPEISNMLNTISKGAVKVEGREIPVPFDAKAYENLQTMLATASRSSSDGNVRAAIKIARDALEGAPLTAANREFAAAGNLPVTPGGAAFLRQGDAAPQAYIDALNQARQAHAARMNWQESSRPVAAALDNAQPDNFVKRFVIGGSLDDAQAVAREAPTGPVRDAILAHLKDKALNGQTDEVGKFSPSAYRKALEAIGDRKLSLFFSPEELANLRNVERAGSLMVSQPVGSAVNNSNSGAMLLGRGMDLLQTAARRVPFGGAAVAEPLANIRLSMGTRGAENVAPALLRAPTVSRPPAGAGFLLPGAALGGLLAAPGQQ